MGRDIYFSTGFYHKFWRGVQPSEDITTFYGEADNQYDDDCGDIYQHKWEAKYDRERILQKIQKYSFPEIDWTQYTANIEGTLELRNTLLKCETSEEILASYILGCVIYHQLLYTECLTCQYEI